MNQIPAVQTPVTAAALYDSLVTAYRQQMGADPARETILCLLAQSALETGRWKYCWCWNLGNIRAWPGWSGAYCQQPRVSEIVNGREVFYYPPDPMTNFRAYGSLDEAAASYMRTLWGDFPVAWAYAVHGDVHAFVKALYAGHYFTATEAPYEAAVASIYQEFDRTIASPSPATATQEGNT